MIAFLPVNWCSKMGLNYLNLAKVYAKIASWMQCAYLAISLAIVQFLMGEIIDAFGG